MAELRARQVDEWLQDVETRQQNDYRRPTPYRSAGEVCRMGCERTFVSWVERDSHEFNDHGDGLTCPECGRRAESLHGYGIHRAIKHGVHPGAA